MTTMETAQQEQERVFAELGDALAAARTAQLVAGERLQRWVIGELPADRSALDLAELRTLALVAHPDALVLLPDALAELQRRGHLVVERDGGDSLVRRVS